MNKYIDKIRFRLPIFLQNIGMSIYGYHLYRRRYRGRYYETLYEFAKKNEYRSEEDILKYQFEELKKLLATAQKHVPYYKKLFAVIGFDYRKMTTVRDIQKIPIQNKLTLRKYVPQLLNETVNKNSLVRYTTSGTTGTPFPIYFDKKTEQGFFAFFRARYYDWAVVSIRDRSIHFGGNLVVSPSQKKPPFWRYNWHTNTLYMSPFHISPNNIGSYIEEILRYKPKFISGYTNSIYSLAKYCIDNNIKGVKIEVALPSSEVLYPYMRATIINAFSCKVFDGYSSREAICLITECEHGNMHVSPEVGLVEIVDEGFQNVPYGQKGRIICTGLLNYAYPLIRFEIGDLGSLSNDDCPCGRPFPIASSIDGRCDDTIYTIDGRSFTRLPHLFSSFTVLREVQFVQKEKGALLVRVSFNDGVNLQTISEIMSKIIRERLGDFKIDFEQVDWIERTPSGKFKSVISEIEKN